MPQVLVPLNAAAGPRVLLKVARYLENCVGIASIRCEDGDVRDIDNARGWGQ